MNKTYILKSVKEDLTAYNGFLWHEGIVEAPDFKPTKECGAGLHGFLMGEGEGTLANWDSKAKWIVAEVDKDSLIDLQGKVKFPKCKVIFIGDRKEATDLIILKGGKSVIGSFVTSGDFGTSTSGDYGTSTSGKKGTSTSGYYGISTSGDYGTSTSGVGGISTSGYNGTSTSGVGGISTSGDYGTSTSGYYGTSTSGVGGTSTSGVGGTSTSGYNGTLVIKYWDNNTLRIKLATAYVGENGILPNTPYVLNEKNEFVKK